MMGATLPVRVVFTGGNQVPIGIEVPKMETIKTPLGDFECFRIELNIGQTFWVANTPQRNVVQFEAEGMTGTLTSIGDGKPHVVRNEEMNFSVEVPGNWWSFAPGADNPNTSGEILLVSKDMTATQVKVMLKETLGDAWLTNQLFRFGASSLLTDVTLQIAKAKDGNYQSADYFSLS